MQQFHIMMCFTIGVWFFGCFFVFVLLEADFLYFLFLFFFILSIKNSDLKKMPALNCWVRCACRTSTTLSHSGPALYWTLMVQWKEPDKWLPCLDHYNSPRWRIPATAIDFLLQTRALLTADLMQACCPSVSPHCLCEHHTGVPGSPNWCVSVKGSEAVTATYWASVYIWVDWCRGTTRQGCDVWMTCCVCDSQPGYLKQS